MNDELPELYISMGLTAENVAKQFGITRQMQDEFAYKSQQKAKAALDKGVFKDEIVPVRAVSYKDGQRVYTDFTVDELPRPETTLEGLGKLPPAFAQGGSVTAGNSSPISDGAAAAVVMSGAKAKELGIKGLGYFRGVSDIDLFELNEAFAAQSVYCQRELGIADDRVNVNGGAIALGHPLGCTGAKLTASALYELRRRGGRYAIVTMCIGGGQGAAGLFEAIK
jgi:acetyl-CoA acyltransferase